MNVNSAMQDADTVVWVSYHLGDFYTYGLCTPVGRDPRAIPVGLIQRADTKSYTEKVITYRHLATHTVINHLIRESGASVRNSSLNMWTVYFSKYY